MSIRTISFRARAEKIRQLDQLASDENRDRTFILNKAIDSLLSRTGQDQKPAAEHSVRSIASKAKGSKERLSRLTPLDLINPQAPTSRHSLLKEMVSAWEKDWSAL